MEQLHERNPGTELPAIVVDRLARIETKLDSYAGDRTEFMATYTMDRNAIESRLSRLERFMWLAIGLSLASAAPNVVRVAAVMGGGS